MNRVQQAWYVTWEGGSQVFLTPVGWSYDDVVELFDIAGFFNTEAQKVFK